MAKPNLHPASLFTITASETMNHILNSVIRVIIKTDHLADPWNVTGFDNHVWSLKLSVIWER
jgi:hypothetical protein